MAEEMRLHLEGLAERHAAAGLSPKEARDAALRQFGHVEGLKEQSRDQRRVGWVEDLFRDFVYAIRSLRSNPGFTAVAVFTLALAIGLNSTTFFLIDKLFICPVAPVDRGHVVTIHTGRKQADGQRSFRAFSFAEFIAIAQAADVFDRVAAVQLSTAAVGRDEDVKTLLVCLVSQDYFSVFGAVPASGRFFRAEETQPNAAQSAAVLSYTFWQKLGGRPDVVGSRITINRRDYTIIGVAPRGFSGANSVAGPEVWLPLGVASAVVRGWTGAEDLSDARVRPLALIGRLLPHLTVNAANARLPDIDARLNASPLSDPDGARQLLVKLPPRLDLSFVWPSDQPWVDESIRTSLGLAMMVLLVASLNLANLLLVRGMTRRKEIAVRLSLGASRGRVVRQLLTEGALLALMGAAAGGIICWWTGQLLTGFFQHIMAGGATSFNLEIEVDPPLLIATLFFCLTATLLFALGPALQATKLDLIEQLKLQPGAASRAGRWNRLFSLQHCLVMGQLALSVMLLFCAGLFVRSNQDESRTDATYLGFQTEREFVAHVNYELTDSCTPDQLKSRQRALLARVRAITGVERASLSSLVPYSTFNWDIRLVSAEQTSTAAAAAHRETVTSVRSLFTAVTDGYFQMLEIPLRRGRDFTPTEAVEGRGRPVAIISEELARTLFGDVDPIGRCLQGAEPGEREIEVVGVVRGPRNDGDWEQRPWPRIYRPLGQVLVPDTYVHVKIAPGTIPGPMLTQLGREMRALDPRTPVLSLQPLAEIVASNVNRVARFLTADIFAISGGLVLILALIGVYGVKAHTVALRTREIGIRIALGARRQEVLALILRQAVVQILVSVAVGGALALAAGRVLSSVLIKISPDDPAALLTSTGLLSTASLVAALVPALRAARTDPTITLRTE